MSEFIQSLPGCEEHGKVFKDEVSVPLKCSERLDVLNWERREESAGVEIDRLAWCCLTSSIRHLYTDVFL